MQVRHEALRKATAAAFMAGGSDAREAAIVADHLVDSNMVGHDSHGVVRIAAYLDNVARDKLKPNQHITVTFESESIIRCDGNQGYGQVVALEALERAIPKARKHGLAMVTMKEGGHIGRIGHYPEVAAAAGLASIFFVNSARPGGAQLAPFGGKDRRLNAGPIALGFPMPGGDPIILDISTAAMAMGKMRLARLRGERLPAKVIVDGHGRLTDDPNAFYADPPGAMTPFGEHKGHGLCVFTDLFAGMLSGAGADYRGESYDWWPKNNFAAWLVDPALFADMGEMAAKVADYAAWVREGAPLDTAQPVLMPGDFERRNRAKALANGVAVDAATWKAITEAAAKFGLEKARLDAMIGAN